MDFPTQDQTPDVNELIQQMLARNENQMPTAPAVRPSAGPDILSLLSAKAAPPPPLPQANPDQQKMLLPMALLQLAATVTQPRTQGQSSFGKILQSTAGAAGYYANENQALQDRAIQQAKEQKSLQLADQQLQNQRVANVRQVQEIADTEEKRPLQLKALEQSLESAKTEQELKTIQVRLARVNEMFAQRAHEADLALKAAQTDESRAKATMEKAHAEDFAKHSSTLLEIANNKLEMARAALAAKGTQENYKALPGGLPGEPVGMYDARSGKTFNQPMEPAAALAHAKRQVAAEVEMAGVTPNKVDLAKRIRAKAQEYMKGTMPMEPGMGGPSDATPTPGATGATGVPSYPKGTTATSIVDLAMQQATEMSKNNPGVAIPVKTPDGMRYLVDGKEVDAATVAARRKGGSTPPTAPAAPASTPSTPAAVTPVSQGPLSQEEARIKAQISQLVLESQTNHNLTMEQRVAIAGALSKLQQQLNALGVR